VITPHGEDIHVIPEIGFGQRLDPFQEPKIRQALETAQAVTAISTSVVKSLEEAGTNPDKIRYVPNGIDLQRFQQSVVFDVHEWLRLPREAQIIVTVGNYHPRKGHDVLLRAMQKVLKVVSSARLVLVGRGTEALLPLINQLNLKEAVRLTGPISFIETSLQGPMPKSQTSPDLLAALYRNSDLYVSPAIGEGAEGLSLSILEAMAAGIPVVGSNISGNRDIIKTGKNGFLVAPADSDSLSTAIVSMLNNGKARRLMGANASKSGASYDWHYIVKKYLAVYEEAMALRL
jgi:glycosyltransferase involved in cell wall biosynthesis